MAYQLGGALSGLYDPDDLEPLTTPYQRLRLGLEPPASSPFFDLEHELAGQAAPVLYRNLSQDSDQGTRRVTNELVDQLLRARNARSINDPRGTDKLRSPNQVPQDPSFSERLLGDYLPRAAIFANDMMKPQIFHDYMTEAEKNYNEGNYGTTAAYLGLAPVGALADVASTAILPAALEKSLGAGAARALSRASNRADEVLGGSRAATGAALAAGGAAMLPSDAEAGANPKWFSTLRQAIENAPQEKMTIPQWMGYLKNRPGIKAEELEYVFGGKASDGNILDLDIKDPVTRRGMLEEFDKNDVPVDELYLGNPLTRAERDRLRELDEQENPFTENYKEPTQEENDEHYRLFGKSQKARDGVARYKESPATRLPGKAEDYREIVVTSPRAEFDDIQPGHFGPQSHQIKMTDKPETNPRMKQAGQQIGWLRGDVRELQDGSRAFHVDEFQSDPAQRALKKGWNRGKQSDEITQIELRADQNRWVFTDALNDPTHPGHADALRYQELERQGHKANHSGVPDRPWKKDWPKLLFRRALWEAVQEDADHLTWTPADIQQKRWGGARLGRDRLYEEVIPKIAVEEAKRLGLPKEAVGEVMGGRNSVTLDDEWLDSIYESVMEIMDNYSASQARRDELDSLMDRLGLGLEDRRAALRLDPQSDGWNGEAVSLIESGLGKKGDEAGPARLYSLKLTPEIRKKILSEGLPTFVGAGIAPGLVERFLSED